MGKELEQHISVKDMIRLTMMLEAKGPDNHRALDWLEAAATHIQHSLDDQPRRAQHLLIARIACGQAKKELSK